MVPKSMLMPWTRIQLRRATKRGDILAALALAKQGDDYGCDLFLDYMLQDIYTKNADFATRSSLAEDGLQELSEKSRSDRTLNALHSIVSIEPPLAVYQSRSRERVAHMFAQSQIQPRDQQSQLGVLAGLGKWDQIAQAQDAAIPFLLASAYIRGHDGRDEPIVGAILALRLIKTEAARVALEAIDKRRHAIGVRFGGDVASAVDTVRTEWKSSRGRMTGWHKTFPLALFCRYDYDSVSPFRLR
jgi:hypothetical protein